MRGSLRRSAAFASFVALTLGMVAVPRAASAQFGGLKKKIKPPTAKEATAPANNGGAIVLSEGVVTQLLTGLKAGKAERDSAMKEDTPFGRYKKAELAYAEAKPKCEAAQPGFYQRAGSNQKMLDKYNRLTNQMVAAQQNGDTARTTIYQDSAMAMMDPSCVVKEPKQPEDYYEAERELDKRAEVQELKASGLARNELALVKERAIAILGPTPPADASASEKSAVSGKSAELKPLLGIREEPVERAAKQAPPSQPAPVAAAAPPSPGMSASAASMNECMMNNIQKHQAEIEALGERVEAAQKTGDQAKMMAIADTLQRIQMAGCTKH
jgi:hypothetical protein